MKKIKLTLIFLILTFISFSQKDYPKIITDSLGNKFVILTYQQAQKIDNDYEILALLEKAGAECDSLTLSYIKVIDEQGNQIRLLDLSVNNLKSQLSDKNSQIINLEQRLGNCESGSSGCDEQLKLKNDQIDLLNGEIKTLKTKRNVAYGVGILGVISGILLFLAFQ